MRFEAKAKMGFYPLPVAEAERIRALLRFPVTSCAALDPCVGEGVAFAAVTSGAPVLRYGIELDSYRAEQARERVPNTLQGNALETHCPVESCSLLYLNPPYDRELGSGQNQRMEQVFLSHTYRWLKAGGVLILVIPRERLVECSVCFRQSCVAESTSAPTSPRAGQFRIAEDSAPSAAPQSPLAA